MIYSAELAGFFRGTHDCALYPGAASMFAPIARGVFIRWA